jgi:hypothetical protein
MLPTYAINPTPPRGYELTGLQFGVVVPVATTNLIPNPSAENDLTDYVVVGTGAALVRSADWAWAGVYSVKATGLGVNSGPSYFLTSGAIVAGTVYSGSVRFKGEAGKTYQLRLATTSATLSPPVRGTGREQEISVTHQADGGGFASLALIQNQTGGQNTIYADAWQIEALPYATTYVDGDRRGFVRGAVEYAWTGQPHASTSTRSGQCRAGGRVIMLSKLGFRLISMIGLGMLPLALVATPLASGGGYYQTTNPQIRDFSLVGDLYAGDLRPLQAQRAELAAVLNPFATAVRQPLLLTYQATDDDDRPISAPCEIVAHYSGGMTGVTDSQHHERLALEFRMFLPAILRRPDSAAVLDTTQDLTTVGLAQRTSAGDWQALTSGAGGVLALAPAVSGGIYVGGNFASAGGLAGTARIAQWTGSAWANLGSGGPDPGGHVYDLAVAPDGTLIAVGDFASMGGVANTNRIAKWDGSTWSSVSSGILGAGGIYGAVFGPDGTLYVTGSFTSINGVAAASIAKRSPAGVWSAMGTGLGLGQGEVLLASRDGGIYVGGAFFAADGVTANGIARWNGTTFTALADGADVGVVYALAETADGTLYAGGDGGGNTSIAAWNGTQWTIPGGGQANEVRALDVDSQGRLYVGGGAGGGIASPVYTVWTGTSWVPSGISVPGTDHAMAILAQGDGTVTVGGAFASPIVTAGSTVVTNAGTAEAAPTFRLTGPAPGSPAAFVYMVANATTRAAIYFDGLYISPGEIITLALEPTNISMTSTFQGNIIGTVIPGSNVTGMGLQPGANVINVYLSDAGTTATVTWRDSYLGVDDAVIR